MLKLFTSEAPARPRTVQRTQAQFIQGRMPQFMVLRDRASSSLWGSVKTIFARVKLPAHVNSGNPFRHVRLEKTQSSGHPFGASLVIHACFILLIVYLHQAMPKESFATPGLSVSEQDLLSGAVARSSEGASARCPSGARRAPRRRFHPGCPPLLGSSARQAVVIISKPVHPDNSHQTIYQPNSPPDIRITQDIKLPNIISVQIPKPVFRFRPSETRPCRHSGNSIQILAHSDCAKRSGPEGIEESSDPHLRVPLLPAVASAPQAQPAALRMRKRHPRFRLKTRQLSRASRIVRSQLQVPLLPAVASAPQGSSGARHEVQEAPPIEGAANGTGLVVISVDPGGADYSRSHSRQETARASSPFLGARQRRVARGSPNGAMAAAVREAAILEGTLAPESEPKALEAEAETRGLRDQSALTARAGNLAGERSVPPLRWRWFTQFLAI